MNAHEKWRAARGKPERAADRRVFPAVPVFPVSFNRMRPMPEFASSRASDGNTGKPTQTPDHPAFRIVGAVPVSKVTPPFAVASEQPFPQSPTPRALPGKPAITAERLREAQSRRRRNPPGVRSGYPVCGFPGKSRDGRPPSNPFATSAALRFHMGARFPAASNVQG